MHKGRQVGREGEQTEREKNRKDEVIKLVSKIFAIHNMSGEAGGRENSLNKGSFKKK